MFEGGGEPRLPARLEVSALVRRVQQEGGFAAVLAKGEPEAGTIMVVLVQNGGGGRAFERMPTASGKREWVLARTDDSGDPAVFSEWINRRRVQDPDLWIVELDIPDAERFIR